MRPRPASSRRPAPPILLLALTAGRAPDFADLDADGDLDVVAGLDSGGLRYLRNTGTSAAPAFVAVTGSASPFASLRPHQPGLSRAARPRPRRRPRRDGRQWRGKFRPPLQHRHSSRRPPSCRPAPPIRWSASMPATCWCRLRRLRRRRRPRHGGDRPGRHCAYFQNTGSEARPAFVEQTGSADPFAAIGDLGNACRSSTWRTSTATATSTPWPATTATALGDVIHFLRNVGTPSAGLFQSAPAGDIFAGTVGWGCTPGQSGIRRPRPSTAISTW